MAERRYSALFITAIAVALLATFAVYRYLQRAAQSAQVPSQSVVVAAQDMPEGTRIERLSLSVNSWPLSTVPPGAFAEPDSLIGRVTRVAVFKGEPIVPGRLAPPGTGPGLEVKITPGKRAMAVKINDVIGLAGLIQPNSRVDVLVTLKEEGSTDKQRAKLFMNDVRVLSVGTQVERGEDGKAISATTAALEVTPAEAERLAVAMNQGSIQLVLRGYGDPDSVKTAGATSNDVLGQLRAQTELASAAPPVRRRIQRDPPPPVVTAAADPRPQQVARRDSTVIEVFRRTNAGTEVRGHGRQAGGSISGLTNPRRHAARRRQCLLSLAIAISFSPWSRSASGQNSDSDVVHVDLPVGRSYLIRSPSEITRVSVANPDIADVVVMSTHDVVVNGRGGGETNVVVWEGDISRQHYRMMVHAPPTSSRSCCR